LGGTLIKGEEFLTRKGIGAWKGGSPDTGGPKFHLGRGLDLTFGFPKNFGEVFKEFGQKTV